VFKNRTFLLGLGIGLAAGALLLELMMIGRAAPEQSELIDRINGEDALYTQTELDEQIAAAEARIRAELQQGDAPAVDEDRVVAVPGEERNGTSSVPDSVYGSDGADSADGAETEPAAKPESVVVDRLPVRIKEGMKLGEVADLLHSKGIIKDRRVFLVLMADASAEITAGYYYFDGELSPADVKHTLLSPPFAY